MRTRRGCVPTGPQSLSTVASLGYIPMLSLHLTTIRGKGGVFGKRWIRRPQIHHEGNGAAVGTQIRGRTPHRVKYARDDTTWLPLITLASSKAYLHVIDPVPLQHTRYLTGSLPQNDGASRVKQCASCTTCLLYTSPSPRDKRQSRMPSSA